ncbi:terminase small subunit [Mycobacterium phage Aegeus]|uniref:hypothetical protein n=1 Tax=Mycobacteroides abscessus TaxID=36809 RepID=UPI000943DF39|nr:hypothetical protein [Mycobacteroides abscessus]UVK63386.1 terminase small subunit [Mycobacterium phage Baudelaire]WKW86493.1 terminase small subunit [Mycobacterium phage Aegeus]
MTTPDVPIPMELGESGRDLWAGVAAGRPMNAASRALLLNACRIADRLDDLVERIGDRLTVINHQGTETINPLIAEHRMQYGALAQVLAKMGLAELPKPKAPGKSARDELAAKRAARQRASKAG